MNFKKSDAVTVALTAFASIAVCTHLYDGFFANTDISTALYDAKRYFALGEALLSEEPASPGRLSIRGYLYPLIAVGLTKISPILFYLVQLLSVCLGVFCLLRSERFMAGKVRATPAALLSVSLAVSPAVVGTEALSFSFAAGALALFVAGRHTNFAVVLLFTAAMIKPAYFPVAFVAVPLTFRFERSSLIGAILVLVIIIPQLVTTHSIAGKPLLSTAGRVNFQNRFYPAVFGMNEHQKFVTGNSEEAVSARNLHPQLRDQIAYVVAHPATAFETWGHILWHHHLRVNSGYTNRDNTPTNETARLQLRQASSWLNMIFVALVIPAILGIISFLKSWPIRSYPAALIGPSILATAPLVYYQGDRVVFSGLLLILPFAGLGLQFIYESIIERR